MSGVGARTKLSKSFSKTRSLVFNLLRPLHAVFFYVRGWEDRKSVV